MRKAPSAPLIVGIGGAAREGSSTEKALTFALRRAEAAGASTKLFDGAFLARLPLFRPQGGDLSHEHQDLLDAVRAADGFIVATPGYHGSVSGLVKNALDSLESLRNGPRPYFEGRPVGTIITADGSQAAGTTLTALRAIIHAMRGWPTPFGAALNATVSLFDEAGECCDAKDAWQLTMVAEQVMEFTRMRAAS